MNNSDKVILHLCAEEGSDSLPYREAGYDVRIIGKDIGVENYIPSKGVYGIIANPPCTHFSIARTTAKTPRDLEEGMRLVKECLRIIWQCLYDLEEGKRKSPLKFWMIENPATGFLRWFLGNPVFIYSPHEYGANYTKRTALWGMFNMPKKPLFINQLPPKSNWCHNKEIRRRMGTNRKRSSCYPEFAKAFYEANK